MRKALTCIAAVAIATLGAMFPQPLEAGVITDGLIGYWAAEGSAVDSSPTANNGGFLGTYVPGITGQAFDLNTGKVYMNDNAVYNFGAADFSMGFWFNANGTGMNAVTFLGQDEGAGSMPKWFIDYNYQWFGGFEIHMNDGAGTSTFVHSVGELVLPTGWNQFLLTRSGNTFSFYLNGSGIGTATSSVPLPNPAALLAIGQAEALSFNGLMDDVVMYNRALTAQEAQTLAGQTPEPGTFLLLGVGLLATAAGLRRRVH